MVVVPAGSGVVAILLHIRHHKLPASPPPLTPTIQRERGQGRRETSLPSCCYLPFVVPSICTFVSPQTFPHPLLPPPCLPPFAGGVGGFIPCQIPPAAMSGGKRGRERL